jgi:capsular polysaccharide transport system permease protein
MGINRLFLFTIVLPTLISGVYFGLIAADVYISESRFVVRSPERQASSPLGMLLKGAGFSRSQDDSYTVYDYILSRDALVHLEKEFQLSKVFSQPKWDIWERFPGIDWDDSFEALFRYYKKRVVVELDTVSSISTLRTSAFNAEDAVRMNEKLLVLSEELINRLNERGRQDMIRFAASEVAVAEKKAKAAALALSSYRNQKGVIDPERQSSIQLQQIAKLQDELIATQGQLTQLQTFTKSNPQIPSLQKRVQTLKQEIAEESSRVAGGDRSLANKAAEYQRLALEREFADKQLGSTLVSLEQARNDAQRKQLYLERIVQPSRPDTAIEPRRIRGILASLALGVIVWGVLTMLIAGVKEHQD